MRLNTATCKTTKEMRIGSEKLLLPRQPGKPHGEACKMRGALSPAGDLLALAPELLQDLRLHRAQVLGDGPVFGRQVPLNGALHRAVDGAQLTGVLAGNAREGAISDGKRRRTNASTRAGPP